MINVDCTHPQARHEHGTYACYVLDGCRCEPCQVARSARGRQWALERAGLKPASFVDATESRAVVQEMVDAGISLKHLARETRLSHGLLSKLMYGGPGDRPPSRKVARRTRDTIREVYEAFRCEDLVLADGAPVDPDEARLIVKELLARGWSKRAIASHVAGEDRNQLQLFKGCAGGVSAGTLRKLREAMCMEVPMRVHGPTGRTYQPKGRAPREVPRTTPHVGGPEYRKLSVVDKVWDVLDAEGGWVTALELIDWVDGSDAAVRMAVRRLVAEGKVEARTGPVSYRIKTSALLLDAG